jgi:hypothetical protein
MSEGLVTHSARSLAAVRSRRAPRATRIDTIYSPPYGSPDLIGACLATRAMLRGALRAPTFAIAQNNYK